MNYNKLLDLRNIQEQVKKAFCYQKLSWPFTVWINCLSDLKKFANSRPSASNFQSFSWSLEQFFLTVGQNNFANKIPFQRKICIISFKRRPDLNRHITSIHEEIKPFNCNICGNTFAKKGLKMQHEKSQLLFYLIENEKKNP